MRDETKLLLSCVTPSLNIKDKPESLLKKDIDWDLIKDTAIRHRVTPLLYSTLKNIGSSKVPDNFIESLRKSILANTSRNAFLAKELHETTQLLQTANISSISFKGPTLALMAYGDISLREFDDIDILIPKNDILKAKDLLTAKGYTPQVELTPAQSEAFLASNRDWAFINNTKRTIIDINSTIMPSFFSFKLDYADIALEAKPVPIEGENISAPSIEDMIIILCVHGTYHGWSRLAWSADLAHIIARNKDINWSKIIKKAEETRSVRMLFLGFSMLNRLYDIPAPQELQEIMEKDNTVNELTDTAAIFLMTDIEGSEIRGKTGWMFITRSRECLQDRINYIIQYIFVPTYSDWKLFPLPGPLFFIYYLTRPFRLIAKAFAKGL